MTNRKAKAVFILLLVALPLMAQTVVRFAGHEGAASTESFSALELVFDIFDLGQGGV